MKLNQDTIDQIHNLLEIEDVISEFVSLKRKGQNLWACCPFHHEKSPSFSVVPSKGFYKCFGCGKTGDAIQFLIDLEGLSYLEAMLYLAKKYGIEVQEEEQTDEQLKEFNEKESLYIVLNFAKEHFKETLWNHEEGRAIGLSYFKERGFTDAVIKSFELGFSLDKWDYLDKEAEKKGYSPEILEKAGLIVQRENKKYDRFRGRVIFPIHNITGKTIAFGARILKSDKKEPKYLNSPETEVYHKGKILYGLYQAKQSIKMNDNCFLVEGYTDVISLHLSGIENVVSSSGTSLTEEQIKLIARYTKNITVLFDGDAAGIKASLRGIDMILENGLNVRVVTFPEGEDPDSYSRKIGSSAFQSFLKDQSTDFIKFKTLLFSQQAANDPIKKADTIKEIIGTIAKVPDAVHRAVYIKECSDLLDIDESILISELNKIQIQKSKDKTKYSRPSGSEEGPYGGPEDLIKPEDVGEETKRTHADIIALQEKESVRILINYGLNKIEEEYHIYDYLLSELEDIEFQTPIYKEILDQFKLHLSNGKILNADYFIRNGSEAVKKEVIDLISKKFEISDNWKTKFKIHIPLESDILQDLVYTNVLRLKLRVIQKLISENLAVLKESSDASDQEKYLIIHSALKKSEMEIGKHLGIVVNR